MNRPPKGSVICVLGLAVFGLGVVMTVVSVGRFGSLRHRMDRLNSLANQLANAEQQAANLNARVAEFDALDYGQLAAPERLIADHFGAERVDDVRQSSVTCGDGYLANRIEVSLKDVTFADVMAFLRQGDALRPPVRLTACSLHASPTEAGRGDAVVKLERIEPVQ